MLARAREIAFPRYPATEGDARAREILRGRFAEAGLEVEEQQFSYDLAPALRAIRVVLTSAALLVGAAGLLAVRSVGGALLLLGLGLAVGGAMIVWAPGAERLYARSGPTRTANVVARRKVESPRLTLIFLAHHDSKSQNFSLPARMGLTLAAIGGGIALLFLLVAGLRAGAAPGPPWLPVLPGGIAALALLSLAGLRSGNHSPGGVDNAGSLAILIELGRMLPSDLPGDVELVFLATGAEEDHMVGAMRWLDAHRGELEGRPVYALNFDSAGAPGRAVAMTRYGLGRSFSPRLARAVRAAAAREGIPLRSIWLPPAMGIDAIPFHHRGVQCLTFASGSLGRATLAVHSAGDVADHLDGETLVRIARLARAVVVDLGDEGRAGPEARP